MRVLSPFVVAAFLLSCLLALAYAQNGSMPQPFTRVLDVQNPPLTGDDVTIMQHLLQRSPFVTQLKLTGAYDAQTGLAVKAFQNGNNIEVSGEFDAPTAQLLLKLHSYDGYKDDGTIPPGFLYKVHIPVHANRSIETTATLYDANLNVLHKFTVRTHGQNDEFGNALNQFSDSGSTPTGLSTFDLNSPEPDPVSFGPYPINREVQGLEGNAAFLISNIRDGILLHTGEWPDWNPSLPMPNSHGCVHAHPEDIKTIWQILVSIGVEVHNNTFGALPYPYKPQGVISIEQIDF